MIMSQSENDAFWGKVTEVLHLNAGYQRVSEDLIVDFSVQTILDDGCYACVTKTSPMSMNEAGDIECWVGFMILEAYDNEGNMLFYTVFRN